MFTFTKTNIKHTYKSVKTHFAVPLLLTAVILVGCSESLTDVDTDASLEAPGASYGNVAEYDVAIRNTSRGQPFTPPLTVTHNEYVDLFTVGTAASFGIKEIAENGNLTPLVEALSNDPNVSDLVVAVAGDPPPLLPRQTVKFRITADADSRYLSFASMLICTNDGFTGLDSIELPKHIGDQVRFGLRGYDAGTEINTEDFADIVPPCQGLVGITSEDEGTGESNPALAENSVVKVHPNVQGGDDLVPKVHGWREPVGKVRIRRVR